MTNEIIKNETVAENKETLTQKFFTTTGRINRLTYFKRSLAILGIEFVLAFVIGIIFYAMSSDATTAEMSANVAITFIVLVSLIPQYNLDTKRLHDIGKDEILAKVFIGVGALRTICAFATVGIVSSIATSLSVISLVFTFYLIFVKGEEVTNDYGVVK